MNKTNLKTCCIFFWQVICVHNVDAIYNIIEINIEANITANFEKGFIFQINGTLQ